VCQKYLHIMVRAQSVDYMMPHDETMLYLRPLCDRLHGEPGMKWVCSATAFAAHGRQITECLASAPQGTLHGNNRPNSHVFAALWLAPGS
jgi:hypothetical protein